MVSLVSCGAVELLEGLLELPQGFEDKAKLLGLKATLSPTHTPTRTLLPLPQQFICLKTFLGSRGMQGAASPVAQHACSLFKLMYG